MGNGSSGNYIPTDADLADQVSRAEVPATEEVNRRFSAVLESMDLPIAKMQAMNDYSLEKKWALVCDQDKTRPSTPPQAYISKLKEMLEINGGKVTRRSIAALTDSVAVLRSIEISLRTNDIRWVQSFLSEENGGLEVLVEYLALAQRLPSMDNNKVRRVSQLRSTGDFTDDIHICILCVKALMNNRYGFKSVMEHKMCVNHLALSLSHPSYRTKTLVCELLAGICLFPGGHAKILSAMDNFKVEMGESRRFEYLVQSVVETLDSLVPVEYQAAVISLTNVIAYTSEDLNYCVHIQYEFSQLGWDIWVQTISNQAPDAIAKQIMAYEANYLDVEVLVDEANLKASAVSQVEDLKQEMRELSEKCSVLENESIAKTAELQKVVTDLKREMQVLKNRKSMGSQSSKTSSLVVPTDEESTQKSTDHHETPKEMTVSASASASFPLTGIPAPPPPPGAPAPPPPPGAPAPPPPPGVMGTGRRVKRQIQTKYRMPAFNWQSILPSSISGTIFSEIDDERVHDIIDFSDFEELFKTKAQPNPGITTTSDGKQTLWGSARKPKKDDTLLETARARNLAITLHRIGAAASSVVDAIERLDLSALPVEFVELLLRVIPTEAEVKVFEKYVAEGKPVKKLPETDVFMLELIGVKRLGQKLRVMAYIGNFFENLMTLSPQLDALIVASNSVLSSNKLKKILEVILAFGNYMNSSKRGGVFGFRLQCLDLLVDLRSTDRTQTLLEYLVVVIQSNFPDVADFPTELQFLEKAANVSLEAIVADVHELSMNMQMARNEHELQPENTILTNFLLNSDLKLKSLVEDARRAASVYKQALLFFGENTKMMPNAFFSMFSRFLKAYKKAVSDMEQRKRFEEAQLESLPSLAEETRGFDKSKRKSKVLLDIHDGALDEAIKGMKNEGYRTSDDPCRRTRAGTRRLSVTCVRKGSADQMSAVSASAHRREKPKDAYLASRPWLK